MFKFNRQDGQLILVNATIIDNIYINDQDTIFIKAYNQLLSWKKNDDDDDDDDDNNNNNNNNIKVLSRMVIGEVAFDSVAKEIYVPITEAKTAIFGYDGVGRRIIDHTCDIETSYCVRDGQYLTKHLVFGDNSDKFIYNQTGTCALLMSEGKIMVRKKVQPSDFFALMVAVCDGYLNVSDDDNGDDNQKIKRFFLITSQLCLEL
jgi:hypothetical protein